MLMTLFCGTMLRVSKADALVVSHPVIFVDSNRGQNDRSCWYGGQYTPCLNLELAIEGLLVMSNSTSHPSLFLQEGTYGLSQTVVLDGLGNFVPEFRMVGNSTHSSSDPDSPPLVVVNCSARLENSTSAGFVFLNVYTNVTIEYVWFYGCGALKFSTSTSQSKGYEFQRFRAGLYFLLCKNIFFNRVWVTNSPGTGAVIYATTGDNSFYYSKFSYNVVPEDLRSIYPGGGGLYLEFPYCLPGNYSSCSTNDSRVPLEYVSESTFYFFGCDFTNNVANVVHGKNEAFILPHKTEHIAFGRGGGFSVFYKGEAHSNTVIIDRCTFTNNWALWGAGVFVEFQDNSRYNVFHMYSSLLQHNVCPHSDGSNSLRTGGGGMRIGYVGFDDGQYVHGNQIVIEMCTFEHNKAYWGGGVSFSAPRERAVGPSNTLNFTNCQWHSNKARLGAAVDLSVWHPLANQVTVEVYFTNTTINSSGHHPTLGSLVGLGAVYINFVPTHFVGYTHFTSNPSTALVATTTVISFHRESVTHFLGNSGRNGGAIALFGSAVIIAYELAELNFESNTAVVKGGAIYSQLVGSHELISSRNCFIQSQAITAAPDDWTARFTFTGNTANGKPSSIYATSILPCVWGGASGPALSNNESKRVFCWNNNGRWWIYDGCTSSDNCSQQIETAPGSFSNHAYKMSIIPGWQKSLPLITHDDFNRLATDGIVLTADVGSGSDYAMIDSNWKFTADYSTKLSGVPNKTVVIDIYTLGPRVLHTQLNVTLSPCPPGYYEQGHGRTTMCTCAHEGYNSLITCTTNMTAILQLQGSWIGYADSSKQQILAGSSPYTFRKNVILPQDPNDLEEFLCGNYSRRGVLCGECSEGHGPAISSGIFDIYDCVKCTEKEVKYGWSLFIITEILPTTILFFLLAVFNISLTSGVANPFIFFSQMITTSFGLYVSSAEPGKTFTKFYTIPYGIWNLNFLDAYLPNYCLHPQMKVATLISLDYIVAIYPLLLILTVCFVIWLFHRGCQPVYWLCRPVHSCYARYRNWWDLKRSVTDSFAAFILLSYTKFLTISGRLLSPQSLYNHNSTIVKTVLYYDGSVGYFEREHIPYIIIAVLVLIVFIIIPPLLLIAYPSKKFHKCLKSLMCNWDTGGKVQLFLNTFYSCYKDGQDPGTRDWRCFAGLYFVFRLVFLSTFYNIYCYIYLDWGLQYTIQQVLCTIGILLFTTIRPYKEDFYNNVDATMFGVLATINAFSFYNLHRATIGEPSDIVFGIVYFLIWCPLVCMVLYLIRHFWKSYDLTLQCRRIWQQEEQVNLVRNRVNDDSILRILDERADAMMQEGQNNDNELAVEGDHRQEYNYGSTGGYHSEDLFLYPTQAERSSICTNEV